MTLANKQRIHSAVFFIVVFAMTIVTHHQVDDSGMKVFTALLTAFFLVLAIACLIMSMLTDKVL